MSFSGWNKELIAMKRRVDQQVGQAHNRWSAAVAGWLGGGSHTERNNNNNNNKHAVPNSKIAFAAAKQSQHVRRQEQQNQKVLVESAASVRSKESETTVPLSNRTEHVLTTRRNQQYNDTTTAAAAITPIMEDELSCSSGDGTNSISIVVGQDRSMIPTVKGTIVEPRHFSPERQSLFPTWQQQQQQPVQQQLPQVRPQPEPMVVRANPQQVTATTTYTGDSPPRMSPERRLPTTTATAQVVVAAKAPLDVVRPQLASSPPPSLGHALPATSTPVTMGRDVLLAVVPQNLPLSPRPPSPIEIAVRNRIASLREALREEQPSPATTSGGGVQSHERRRRRKDAPAQRRPDAPTTATTTQLRPRPELSFQSRSGGGGAKQPHYYHDDEVQKKDTSLHSLVETSCSDDNEDDVAPTSAQRCSSPLPMETIFESNLMSSPFSHLTTAADMHHHHQDHPLLVLLEDPEEKKEPDGDRMIRHDHSTTTTKKRHQHPKHNIVQDPAEKQHDSEDRTSSSDTISNHAVATTKQSNRRPPQGKQHNVQLVHNHQLTDPHGDTGRYTGILVNNRPHDSHGTMEYDHDDDNPQRITYTGGWHRGRWHGHGTARFANGDSYTGTYVGDVRHGPGRYTWADGRIFDGQFAQDQRQGKGTYRWPDGSVYMGMFVNGLRHGEGTLTFASSSIYTGEWKEGKQHGQGECVWPDGRCYRGEWVEGRAHGYGVEVRANGSIRHDGRWDMDRPVRSKQKPSSAITGIQRHLSNTATSTAATRGKNSPIELRNR